MKVAWIATVLLSLCSALAAANTVTPLDALTTIDPRTGHSVTGIGGDGGTDWQKANPIWDGHTVQVHAARGETMTVQLVFTDWESHPLQGIDIHLDLPQVADQQAWRAWCIWGAPEIAVPLAKPAPSFDLPSKSSLEVEPFSKGVYKAWSAGIDFTVPRDTKPGSYTGTLVVTAKSGMEPQKFPVALEVLPFDLPRRPTLLVEMNSYGDYEKFLKRDPATYIAIQRLMRAHRCSFVEIPYDHAGSIDPGYLAPQVIHGKDGALAFDWKEFDAAVGPVLDGSAFADKVPVTHFTLPFNYNWPVSFRMNSQNPAEYRKENIEARKLFAAHFREKGWKDTVFVEFHNEKKNGSIHWDLDEPQSASDLQGHELFAGFLEDALKDEAPGGATFRYRVDISNWKRSGSALEKLAPKIQFWSVSRDPGFLNATSAAMFRKFADAQHGWVIDYGELEGFESGGKLVNGSTFDRYARNCWELHLNGYEQWMIDLWACKGRNAPTEPLMYSQAAGARDLIWPGNYFGSAEPLPSLRLKAIRESMNLIDYATMAEQKRPEKKAAIDALIHGLDSDTAASHFAAKAELAGMLKEKGK
ncbi:MAG: hypothetical protein ACREJ2_15330 [Planctomycetota bacterium]